MASYYAEIADGKVIDIFQADAPLAPNWVVSNEHVRVGMIWSPSLLSELVSAAAAETKAQADSASKLQGVLFDGVMCSATKEDMWGLNSVLTNYQMSGQAFLPTRFDFSNGNSLVITKDNIQAFTAVWVPFRQGFYAA
jgi:hypothetical protein